MRVRGGTIKDLAQKLEEARTRVAETHTAIETEETALATTCAQRDDAIGDAALFSNLSRVADNHRSELERLALVLSRDESLKIEADRELARARHLACAGKANSAGAAAAKASERVAELVRQLAAACDAFTKAERHHLEACERARELGVLDEESALLGFEEAEAERLGDVVAFLEAKRQRQFDRAETRHAIEQRESRAAALARAEKRAEEIVAHAYAAAPDGEAPRGVWNERLAPEGLDVRRAVQRRIYERERERKRELNPVR